VTVSPSGNPMGMIQGYVYDAETGVPLSDIVVAVANNGQWLTSKTSKDNAGSRTVNEGGYFRIKNLAVGSTYKVYVNMDLSTMSGAVSEGNYVVYSQMIEIPNNVGYYSSMDSVVNMNVMLPKASATISGTVYSELGSPAVNVQVVANLKAISTDDSPITGQWGEWGFEMVKAVTTDAAGKFTITGVPALPQGLSIPLFIASYDADNDGIEDYSSISIPFYNNYNGVESNQITDNYTRIVAFPGQTFKVAYFLPAISTEGTLQGIIIDGQTGQGLGGIIVGTLDERGVWITTTSISDDPATSFNEAGYYRLKRTNQGYFKIHYNINKTNATYAELVVTMSPGSNNEYPNTQNIQLPRLTGRLEGMVVTKDNGPAQGATVVLDMNNIPNSSPACYGCYSSGFNQILTATTDANGGFAFANLPALLLGIPLQLMVLPLDINGDGVIDYGARYIGGNNGNSPPTNTIVGQDDSDNSNDTLIIFPGQTRRLNIILANAGTLVLLSSNVADAFLGTAESIQVIFSEPIKTDQARITLTDNTINAAVGFNKSWSNSDTTLTIAPTATLRENRGYTVAISMIESKGGITLANQTWAFTAINPAAQITTPVQNVRWVNDPTWIAAYADPTTVQINYNYSWPVAGAQPAVMWDPIPNVSNLNGYRVYGRVVVPSPYVAYGWVRMNAAGGSGDVLSPNVTRWRPVAGDRNFTSFDVTPSGLGDYLGYGARIELVVVPVNSDGVDGPIPTPTISITDRVRPNTITVPATSQITVTLRAAETANNQAAGCMATLNQAKTIHLDVGFPEPMDQNFRPTLTWFPTPASGPAVTFRWNNETASGNSRLAGTFDITVPPCENYLWYGARINWQSTRDTSGNLSREYWFNNGPSTYDFEYLLP
jgi:hypothetical protein